MSSQLEYKVTLLGTTILLAKSQQTYFSLLSSYKKVACTKSKHPIINMYIKVSGQQKNWINLVFLIANKVCNII